MALRGGIDLGGTKIEAVVVDPDGAVVGQSRGPTPHEGGPPAVIKALASGLQDAAKAAGVEPAELSGVGVAVDAEAKLGAGKDYASFLGVWWGTGIGGAVVVGGKRWLGRGAAGEIGHTVVKLGGRRCECGRRGCLEAYAGRGAMERRARREVAKGTKTDLFDLMEKHGRARLTSGIWARALHRDDKLAHKLIGGALEALGAGIAST